MLSVDLYDQEAARPVLDSVEFYRDCRAVLADGGVMTVNLFGRRSSFPLSFARIVAAFGADQVHALKPTPEGNTIVVAMKHVTVPGRSVLARRAENIETRWQLPARKWLRMLNCPAGRCAGLRIRAAARMKSTTKSAPPDPAATGSGAAVGELPMERSISTSRPVDQLPATDLTLPAAQAAGKLTWRTVLAWLREDKILSAEDVDRTAHRFAGGNSAQHPLVRIGSAGLTRIGDGKVLDAEALTEWLAKRSKLPYVRIDPLKVDVGRVADVMSINYAERRHALPLNFGINDVTIATCEPLDIGWVSEIESHTKRRVRLVIVNPVEIARYTTEFYALSRSVRNATKMGESSALANFEQLVELGKSTKQLDANDSGVVQVVDWLWQYAFDQRASDIHLEPRRERSVIRFRIDGVMHTVYQLPPGVMSAMIARVKLLGRMDVVEKRRPLDGRIKVRNMRRRRGRDAPVDHAHRVRREDGDADLRSRHHRQDAREPRLRQPRRQALGGAGVASRTASSWSPARPARARRRRSTRRCGGWPPTRSTSARSRTRSR